MFGFTLVSKVKVMTIHMNLYMMSQLENNSIPNHMYVFSYIAKANMIPLSIADQPEYFGM